MGINPQRTGALSPTTSSYVSQFFHNAIKPETNVISKNKHIRKIISKHHDRKRNQDFDVFSADDKKTTKGRNLLLKNIKPKKEIETDSHV
jgi:hypothetical protein